MVVVPGRGGGFRPSRASVGFSFNTSITFTEFAPPQYRPDRIRLPAEIWPVMGRRFPSTVPDGHPRRKSERALAVRNRWVYLKSRWALNNRDSD